MLCLLITDSWQDMELAEPQLSTGLGTRDLAGSKDVNTVPALMELIGHQRDDGRQSSPHE